MEILKGKVQDPGFPDTEITYIKTDDGKTYFFIENGTLKNGNIISTPNLKEGIGHAPYTSLGLITPQGDILIPFENKNIQVLSSDLLLVERNTPITDSVVEAIKKQNDPLSANDLVQNANTIKEQIKSVMGMNGTYVFDNQFSEAALYTTDGVNLANNYFSFIGVNDGAYYMSKNIVGDSIVKYDPYANAMADEQNENSEESENNITTQEENTDMTSQVPQTDQNSAEVPMQEGNQETVDTQNNSNLDSQEQSQDIVDPQNQTLENNDQTPLVPSINEENIQNNPEQSSTDNSQPQLGIDIPLFQNQSNSNEEDANDNTAQENILPSLDTEDTSQQEDLDTDSSTTLNIEEDMNLAENNSTVEDSDQDNEEENSDDNTVPEEVESDDSEDDTTEIESESDDSDDSDDKEDTDEEEKEDTTDKEKDEHDNEEIDDRTEEEKEADFEEQITNPVIANATNTIRKLLEENRKQRQMIDHQETELESLKSSNEILTEDNNSKTKEIVSLRNSMGKYRNQINELSRENNRLKSISTRHEDMIEHLKNQNNTLKEQVAGITALGNAVAEANNIFTPTYDSDEGLSYLDSNDNSFQYQKVA